MPDRGSRVAPLLLFAAAAVVWTWPLAAHLSSRVPHDPGDPLLNTWLLWWNAQAVPFTDEWWNPPFFFPMAGALALSEHLAGLAPLTTPLLFAGATPLAAYNVALIASFALSAYFAFLLVLRLTGSRLAALCAGALYGFAPYRAGQLAHLQVLTSQWMPLALLALHAFVAGGRRAWLLVFGAAWLLQALSNGYYLLFLPVLIALWLAWFVPWRTAPRVGLEAVGAWAVASLALLPGLLHYRDVHRTLGLSRPIEEIRRFSATAGSFLEASPMLRLWTPSHPRSDEDYLFPGITVIALLVVAAAATAARWRARDSRFVFYGGAAVLMALLALGPWVPGDGLAGVLRPYTLLSFLPGFDGLRVPARFAMLATLCASIAAGLAFARLAPASRRARLLFAGVVLAGVCVDGWMRPMPLFAPPPRVPLPDVTDAAVIELPADDAAVSVGAMYRSISHGRPLVSGYSGHTPPHYSILSTALRREDPSPLLHLARGRPLVIVIDHRRDPGGDYRRLVGAIPGIERRQATGAGEVYVLPRLPRDREAPPGGALPLRADDSGIDLGAPKVIRTLEIPVRHRYLSLHTRLRVYASTDGATWFVAWEDWTGGAAVAAALRDPRVIPLRITLPDITARYLRLEPAPDWLYGEITIFGI